MYNQGLNIVSGTISKVEFPTHSVVLSGRREPLLLSNIYTYLNLDEKCACPVPLGKLSPWLELEEEVAQCSWLHLSRAEFLSSRYEGAIEAANFGSNATNSHSSYSNYVSLNNCFFIIYVPDTIS